MQFRPIDAGSRMSRRGATRCVLAALAVVAVWAAQAGAPATSAPAPDAVLVGRVTKVTDGDTLKVQLSSGPITVRLDGVDTPEKDQPWGREATSALSALVLGRDVELDVVTQDRYERLVAQIAVDGVSVNELLVKEGHAWAFRRYLKRSQAAYCTLEASARASRRGLWSRDPRDWVYPSDWRRLKRGAVREVEDFSQETAHRCVEALGKR